MKISKRRNQKTRSCVVGWTVDANIQMMRVVESIVQEDGKPDEQGTPARTVVSFTVGRWCCAKQGSSEKVRLEQNIVLIA